jgi:hypothetical protein
MRKLTPMSKAPKTPPWVFAHVQKCRDAFGIGYAGFEFHLEWADVVDGEAGVAGSTYTDPRYHRARVILRRGLKATDRNYTVVTHEVLHAATGEMRQALDRIIELVPPHLRDHAEELWADGNEAVITRLAVGLTPLLRAMDRTPIEDSEA